MKKLVWFALAALTVNSCKETGGGDDNSPEYCKYNGHQLYVGEKGGCYYLSSGGNKEYVDKKYCASCN
ncbi:hypothetical protein [Chryseobacterium hagamense]|uniref:Uncharacterized protein n=1 Tax=Chryseobacterium hagamense TaxID=395935 RepID=A0A511YPK7_9FLAO|nr:hypothetical protein [Chryseobacterium hagamense]GEN77124.1 hypothetical protein CHA01nite_28640 [Chryseobacterium hagamense]